jgi:putative FmdB family regulatory protein
MPIYEYRCKKCGATFEKIVMSKSAKAPTCPKCGADAPQKLLSAPGAVGVSVGKGSAAASCPAGTSGQCASGFS